MINLKTAAALVGIGLLASSCFTPETDQSRLFQEWSVNIDQPIGQLEEIFAKLDQQQPRNYTISNVAFLYDAKLHILFHDYLDRLPAFERVAVLQEQREWLELRKAQVDEAYAEYEGGTLASYTAGQASINTTKKRIAVIEKRMKETFDESVETNRRTASRLGAATDNMNPFFPEPTSTSSAEPLPLLHEQPFQAVILPADSNNHRRLPKKWGITDFWTPTSDEVKAAEERIAEFIALAAIDKSLAPFRREMRAEIRDHPETCIRQYFGGVRSGQKVIVCSGFRKDFGEIFMEQWREEYVRMSDATGNWRIEYDSFADRCDRFYVDEGF